MIQTLNASLFVPGKGSLKLKNTVRPIPFKICTLEVPENGAPAPPEPNKYALLCLIVSPVNVMVAFLAVTGLLNGIVKYISLADPVRQAHSHKAPKFIVSPFLNSKLLDYKKLLR